MTIVRTTLAALGALAFAGITQAARPLVIEDSARIANPDPAKYQYFGITLATNGEWTIADGFREDIHAETYEYYALLYRRVNGQWVFQRELWHVSHPYDSYYYPVAYAMRGDYAAVELEGRTHMFHFDGSDWSDTGKTITGFSTDIEIDGTHVAVSTGEVWNASVSELTSKGNWRTTFLHGQPRMGDDENWGGPVDILGSHLIIGTPQVQDLEPQEIPVYQRSSTGVWSLQGKIGVPEGRWGLGGPVALRGNDALVDAAGGPLVWHLDDLTTPVDQLRAVDAVALHSFDSQLERSGNFVFNLQLSTDRNAYVYNVFQANSAGKYPQVAVLAAKNGVSLYDALDAVGNTVLVRGSDNALHEFKLPSSFTSPASRYENFESGAGNWTAQSGSQFAVALRGTNHVYRQSSLAGDARAFLADTSWKDQGIEADILPQEFNGSDRWVGLITRYKDAQNYTYVTLRSSGTVQLRQVRSGTITTLASAPLSLVVNRTYRTRLESVGSVHRVYVDGKLLLDVDDTNTPTTGSAGIAMYRARAEFDNVVVSPAPHTTIFANDFNTQYEVGYWYIDAGTFTQTNGAWVQSSTAGDARAQIGTPVDDQIVQASVRPTSYAAPSGTQARWTGVLARYRDAQNYYYLSLRNDNTLSLRKLVNGTITELASVPFTVALNTRYVLRLEAVGNQLRGYVNGGLRLQASDSSHASGSGGIVSYKAAATFDDYVAYQP
jgi:hypothetical protein